ncbi:hypothetical protein K493DRAFT_310009 [Basidiobolus meristosporus CBS 931.73]|uniref:RNI-like protein n=1 Tax=Basidiobolus meristosporus CBS 931.73 TaxID=1314790 RepID=A0A1Y1ZDF8_9FUNG|nr:hypothetical protein K493DRAFT_310009 [Basidiobolus meristosporus CBS 931.73]|eukprot:ORY07997.1 hypothetical protein K493DRAFT_310009 [Basidiobolus meristosporus CBS 931.73]
MMYKILAVLSLAMVGSAQTVCQDEFHVKSQADLNTISSCYSTLTISNTQINTVDLSRLEKVTDDLIISNNTELVSILLPNLKSVGTLNIHSNRLLNHLNVASLATAEDILVNINPKLQSLDFTTGLEKVEELDVNSNGIYSLRGLEKVKEMDKFVVTANGHLKDIHLANLTTITDKLAITNNNFDFEFSAPKLVSTGSFSVNNVTSLNLASLTNVNEVLDFSYNFFEKLDLGNVTKVADALSIIGNSKLSNVTFPALESIGGALLIANNSALHIVEGFDKLTTIGGSLQIVGALTNLTLPELKNIKGITNIQSSDEFDCAQASGKLEHITASHNFTCKAKVAKPTMDGGNGATNGEKDHGKSDDKDKDHKNGATIVRGGYALVVVLAACLFL